MPTRQHIIVLGAGVTGLTSAILLAEAGYDVTIIAAHVPGDSSIEYTSPWAGAHWMTHASSNEIVQQDWDIQTYNYMLSLIERQGQQPGLPALGLKLNKGYKLYTGGIPDGELWWAPHVKHFQQESLVTGFVAEVNAKAHGKVKPIDNAISYTSISINAPQYLLYLQARALRFGIVVIKSQLPSDKGFDHALTAAEALAHSKGRAPAALFVNATGLGAYKLCNDHTMFPIRGQTVLVKGEAIAERTRSGNEYASYCIPRPGSGSTILGGTRQKGEWNETPDQQTTQDILERASWMVPELLTGPDGGFEVISVQCGLRPGRTDGPRMEKEIVANKKVVHAYGHAGAGYQNSIGSARLVVRLVQQSLVEKASAKL